MILVQTAILLDSIACFNNTLHSRRKAQNKRDNIGHMGELKMRLLGLEELHLISVMEPNRVVMPHWHPLLHGQLLFGAQYVSNQYKLSTSEVFCSACVGSVNLLLISLETANSSA